MAAAKTKKRSIIIGNKEYTMPQKMSTMAYLRYLEVRDSIMDTEAKQALYTRQQFMDMMDVIVEMYGNQFTTDDMLDAETGMTPDSIVMEFALMDVSVGEKVDKRTEDFAKNFTNDAGTDSAVWTQRICLHDDFSGNVSQIYGNHGTE